MTVNEVLSLALSILQSLGLVVYIQAFVIIALVGGFIAVIFRRN